LTMGRVNAFSTLSRTCRDGRRPHSEEQGGNGSLEREPQVVAVVATPETAKRAQSASGAQQATQTGYRLGFDRCTGVADHDPLRVDPSDQGGNAALPRSDEIVYYRS
jgi:hypothetical protein